MKLSISPASNLVVSRFPKNPLSTTPAGKCMDKYPFSDCLGKNFLANWNLHLLGPKKKSQKRTDHQIQTKSAHHLKGIWIIKFNHLTPLREGLPDPSTTNLVTTTPLFAVTWWNPHLQWSTIQFVNFHRGILDDNGLSKRGQSVHKKKQRPAQTECKIGILIVFWWGSSSFMLDSQLDSQHSAFITYPGLFFPHGYCLWCTLRFSSSRTVVASPMVKVQFVHLKHPTHKTTREISERLRSTLIYSWFTFGVGHSFISLDQHLHHAAWQ